MVRNRREWIADEWFPAPPATGPLPSSGFRGRPPRGGSRHRTRGVRGGGVPPTRSSATRITVVGASEARSPKSASKPVQVPPPPKLWHERVSPLRWPRGSFQSTKWSSPFASREQNTSAFRVSADFFTAEDLDLHGGDPPLSAVLVSRTGRPTPKSSALQERHDRLCRSSRRAGSPGVPLPDGHPRTILITSGPSRLPTDGSGSVRSADSLL